MHAALMLMLEWLREAIRIGIPSTSAMNLQISVTLSVHTPMEKRTSNEHAKRGDGLRVGVGACKSSNCWSTSANHQPIHFFLNSVRTWTLQKQNAAKIVSSRKGILLLLVKLQNPPPPPPALSSK